MSSGRTNRFFAPHDHARAEALAGAPLASFTRRLAAWLIDTALVFATYGPAIAVLHYILDEKLHVKENLYDSPHVHLRFDFHEFGHVAWVLWLVLYFGLFVWWTNGRTPGKRLLGIRVASLTNEHISLWQSIERALGYGASALECGFGFLQYFTNHNHCCVHDRIAETIVIRAAHDPKAPTQDEESKRRTGDKPVEDKLPV